MNRRTAVSRAALAASALLAVLIIAGCAASTRLPECHGPWIPINSAKEGRARG
jgi:hypothetical protein